MTTTLTHKIFRGLFWVFVAVALLFIVLIFSGKKDFHSILSWVSVTPKTVTTEAPAINNRVVSEDEATIAARKLQLEQDAAFQKNQTATIESREVLPPKNVLKNADGSEYPVSSNSYNTSVKNGEFRGITYSETAKTSSQQ